MFLTISLSSSLSSINLFPPRSHSPTPTPYAIFLLFDLLWSLQSLFGAAPSVLNRRQKHKMDVTGMPTYLLEYHSFLWNHLTQTHKAFTFLSLWQRPWGSTVVTSHSRMCFVGVQLPNYLAFNLTSIYWAPTVCLVLSKFLQGLLESPNKTA